MKKSDHLYYIIGIKDFSGLYSHHSLPSCLLYLNMICAKMQSDIWISFKEIQQDLKLCNRTVRYGKQWHNAGIAINQKCGCGCQESYMLLSKCI